MFREEIIPLIYLKNWFGLLPGAVEAKKNFIVFAGDDDNKIGLVVDSLIGRREIVIKSLDKRYVDVNGFAGMEITLSADEARPQEVLIRAHLADGHEIVALADGSVQQVPK